LAGPPPSVALQATVSANGIVSIDRPIYCVGTAYAGNAMTFQLHARLRQFLAIHRGQVIKTFEIQGLYEQAMSFGDYLRLMLDQARSIDRQQQVKMARLIFAI